VRFPAAELGVRHYMKLIIKFVFICVFLYSIFPGCQKRRDIDSLETAIIGHWHWLLPGPSKASAYFSEDNKFALASDKYQAVGEYEFLKTDIDEGRIQLFLKIRDDSKESIAEYITVEGKFIDDYSRFITFEMVSYYPDMTRMSGWPNPEWVYVSDKQRPK